MIRSSNKKARIDNDEITPEGGFRIRVYRPTWEEMKNFSAFIKKIHDEGGNRPGLAKIIPPNGYTPRKAGYGDDKLYDMYITSPIKQEVSGESGLYQQLNLVEKKRMTVRNFKRLAEDKYTTPHHDTYADLERIFWKNIFTQPSIYGADVSGSLFDDDVEEFNLTKLNTILDDIGHDYGVTIQGVNTAYLYFGMWKTSFCWHTEDVDLYSINYLHDGAPKSWYCIAPEHGKRFERLAASFFPHSFRTCRAFLRHKTTLISPAILKKYSIPFSKMTQEKGEFMITFPYSYHSGYNHGFNIAEATNFALEYWVDFGKWATRCECSPESVKISMQTFVKRYQSDRYDLWLKGKDVCKDPRDPKHVSAAPKPTEYDLYLMGTHEKQTIQEEEEMETSKKNALQQNQSSNVKGKSKTKKICPTLDETYQRYSEFLLQNDQNNYSSPIQLQHFSAIPNQMVRIDHLSDTTQNTQTGSFSFVPRNADPYIGSNQNLKLSDKHCKKPNYEKQLKEVIRAEAKRRKKEEKARIRKEKRAKDSIIPTKELLQFLPLTFTHEKRFNRCMAALPPHCSVCQLLEPHPKDDENIWGNTTNNTPHDDKVVSDSQTSTAIQTPDPITNEPQITEHVGQTTLPTTAGLRVEEFKLPESSSISLPRSIFNYYPENSKFHNLCLEGEEEYGSGPRESSKDITEGDSDKDAEARLEFIDMSLESDLLQCVVCMLCVHKTCYGLSRVQTNKIDWICDRCVQPNRSLVNCELCPCRGGALKKVRETWMHITCALTIPDIRFTDLIKPEQSTPTKSKLDGLTQEKNPCIYCFSTSSIAKYAQGRCIGCSGYWKDLNTHVTCPHKFHPTCGHRNGAKFDFIDLHEDADMKSPVRATCAECVRIIGTGSVDLEEVERKEELSLEKLPEGTSVIALAGDGFYRDGIIESYRRLTLYDLFFPEENGIETHVSPDRINNFNPEKKYSVGDEFSINGFDEGPRVAKYRGEREVDEYHVKFESKTEKVSRRNIYHQLDQMPEDLFNRYKKRSTKSSSQTTETANDQHLDVD